MAARFTIVQVHCVP